MVMSQVGQDKWGTMTIDMMTCLLNVMGLAPTQPATITITEMPAETPTLEDMAESEDWRGLVSPPSDLNSVDTIFFHHWQLTTPIYVELSYTIEL